MGRCNVKYKGRWATFSSITDSFVSKFTDKESYENWRKKEYGIYYRPIRERSVRSIEEVTVSIRMNRNHDDAMECLLEAGLERDEAEQILHDVEMKHWHPIPTEDGRYKCPNCGAIVNKGQERCPKESCEMKLVW